MCQIKEHSKVLELFNKFMKKAKLEIFDKLQGEELPNLVVTLKPQKESFAYCTMYKAFKNEDGSTDYLEISYNIQELQRTTTEILVTLLHEMIHAYHYANDIKDCTKSQYHNNKFKTACDNLGLIVEKYPRFGWNTTGAVKEESISDTTIKSFIEEHQEEIKVISELLAVTKSTTSKPKSKNLHVFVCTNCGAKARAKAGASLYCGECLENVYEEYEEDIQNYKMKDTTEDED